MLKRQLTILAVLVLVAAALNVPIAVQLIHSRTQLWPGPALHVTGAAAASRGWPHRTPHETAWPAPDYWTVSKEFGGRYYHIASRSASDPTRNAYSMQYETYGWPLPVLHRVQMWWDWEDPALKGPESDPAMALYWPGLVLNPLIVGGGVWALVIAPWALYFEMQRAKWRRSGRCLRCGYPTGVGPVCTECGTAVG